MLGIRARSLGKSIVVVGITAAVSQLLSIGYLVFLARWIGPETYALHVGIFNLCAISAFLINWGLDTWLLKQTSENQTSSMSVLKGVLLLKFGFGILWAIVLFIVAPLLKPEIFIREFLFLAILSTVFESLTNSIYTVFLTTNRFKQSSAILLIGRLFRLGSLIGLYFLSINSLRTIIYVRTLIDLITLIIAGVIFGLRFTGWRFPGTEIKSTFVDAVPFHASELVNIVFRNVDVTLVTFLSKSLTTISSYSLMVSFFNVISTIILSLMNVVVPSLSKEKAQSGYSRRITLLRTIIGFFFIGLVGWILVGLLGRQAIQWILGNQYLMVANFISRTAVIVLISSFNIGLIATIIVSNRQRERIVPQIISLILKVIASLMLFPMWQIEGLRWIYLLSELVLTLGYLFVISRIFKEQSGSATVSRKADGKLKIALITFNQEGKGTYLRAYFLGIELVKLGHEVTILAGSNAGKHIHERTEDGLKIVTFPRLLKDGFQSGWNFDELIYRLLWAKRNDFDLVHAFECRPTTLFPARLLQSKGAAFFTDWADWLGKGGSVEERPKGLRKSLLGILETYFENRRFHKSDGITAICSTLVKESLKRGYPPGKVLLLPNGMSNPYLQSFPMEVARAKVGLENRGLIIGYLGSGFEKDMELMYSAFSALKERIGGATLLHTGRSNYYTEPDITIICTGPVSYKDVSYYLSACDIFWFPLRRTTANFGRMPLKFSDYLTIGRPIISTDVGDLADWIRSLQVGFVGIDDPESLSNLVLEIYQSPELMSTMQKNALMVSKGNELSWKKRAKELQDFYYSQITSTREVDDNGIDEVQVLQ